MVIVMPMAGRGTRFPRSIYPEPKPFVVVEGRPIFAWAMKSLEGLVFSKFIVIALSEHKAYLELHRRHFPTSTEFILLDDVTQGQLCTVLAAKQHIQTTEDVLIASADTWVISTLGADIYKKKSECKGLISVINMPGEQWSFAKTDKNERVIEVAEKNRISDHVSTGLYYFSSGAELVEVAEDIILANEMIRGEYYIIPVYQRLIQKGNFVGISKSYEMWDFGTPDAVSLFLNKKYSKTL